MCASKTRKEKLSDPGENCRRDMTDLAGSLVTSSRPPSRPQTRPDDRTSNAGVAVRTADGSRRTADDADEQCLRCGRWWFVGRGRCPGRGQMSGHELGPWPAPPPRCSSISQPARPLACWLVRPSGSSTSCGGY